MDKTNFNAELIDDSIIKAGIKLCDYLNTIKIKNEKQ